MSNQINLTKKVINAVTQGRGLRGYSVIIDSNAGMIQWRQDYTGAPWNDIIDIADLKGEKGDQMFTWKGAYSAALTYNPGDMVCLSGALYVCLALAVGQDPTTANSTYWTQLVFNSYNIMEGDPA